MHLLLLLLLPLFVLSLPSVVFGATDPLFDRGNSSGITTHSFVPSSDEPCNPSDSPFACADVHAHFFPCSGGPFSVYYGVGANAPEPDSTFPRLLGSVENASGSVFFAMKGSFNVGYNVRVLGSGTWELFMGETMHQSTFADSIPQPATTAVTVHRSDCTNVVSFARSDRPSDTYTLHHADKLLGTTLSLPGGNPTTACGVRDVLTPLTDDNYTSLTTNETHVTVTFDQLPGRSAVTTLVVVAARPGSPVDLAYDRAFLACDTVEIEVVTPPPTPQPTRPPTPCPTAGCDDGGADGDVNVSETKTKEDAGASRVGGWTIVVPLLAGWLAASTA